MQLTLFICFLMIGFSWTLRPAEEDLHRDLEKRELAAIATLKCDPQCKPDEKCEPVNVQCFAPPCPQSQCVKYELAAIATLKCDPQCKPDEKCEPVNVQCFAPPCPQSQCVKYAIQYRAISDDPCNPNPCRDDETCQPSVRADCVGKLCLPFECHKLSDIIKPCPQSSSLEFDADGQVCQQSEDCPFGLVCCPYKTQGLCVKPVFYDIGLN